MTDKNLEQLKAEMDAAEAAYHAYEAAIAAYYEAFANSNSWGTKTGRFAAKGPNPVYYAGRDAQEKSND